MNRQVDSEAPPTTRQPFDAASEAPPTARQPFDAARYAAAEKNLCETIDAAAAAQQMKERSSFAVHHQDMMAMDKRTENKEQKEKEKALNGLKKFSFYQR